MASPRDYWRRASDYNRLTAAAKQAREIDSLREPSVPCPVCQTQTTPTDLLHHLDRCDGSREPHPLSKWITWRQALDLGASRSRMHSWVGRGMVRVRGDIGERQYLLRDLALRLADRNARREFRFRNRRKPR